MPRKVVPTSPESHPGWVKMKDEGPSQFNFEKAFEIIGNPDVDLEKWKQALAFECQILRAYWTAPEANASQIKKELEAVRESCRIDWFPELSKPAEDKVVEELIISAQSQSENWNSRNCMFIDHYSPSQIRSASNIVIERLHKKKGATKDDFPRRVVQTLTRFYEGLSGRVITFSRYKSGDQKPDEQNLPRSEGTRFIRAVLDVSGISLSPSKLNSALEEYVWYRNQKDA